MNILLIEDNDLIIKGLKYLLVQHSFNVDVASNLKKAALLVQNKYDLIVLDLMLPDGDGLNFYKHYINGKTPTIILTAKDDEEEVVACLDAGCEDYIVKPFRSNELLSRINNILRRNYKETVINIGNIMLNKDAGKVFVNKREVKFTGLEYKILVLLFENVNHIVTRDVIFDKIWDMSGKFVNDNTLTVYIKRIREKLENDDIIKTIKGIGYRVDKWKII